MAGTTVAPQSHYELKAGDWESLGRSPTLSPATPAGARAVAEMHGDAPACDLAWSGMPPPTTEEHTLAGRAAPPAHEMPGETSDRHQRPVTPMRAHMAESVQNTPLEMIRPEFADRKF